MGRDDGDGKNGLPLRRQFLKISVTKKGPHRTRAT
jgi:hypothetical protein